MSELPDQLLIGMIHLPKTRGPKVNLKEIIDYALKEVAKLENLGFAGVMVENFNDLPFNTTQVSEEELVKIGIIVHEIRKNCNLLLGLNLLRNACNQAMIVSSIVNFDFIRCNIWEGAYVTDQGIIEAASYEVIKTKELLESKVKVFADIFVKHAKPLVEFDPIDVAENVLKRGKADRIIVSGTKTGSEAPIDLIDTLNSIGIKPIIGSGISSENVEKFKNKISGAIVGTSIKEKKIVTNPISIEEGKKFVANWNSAMD